MADWSWRKSRENWRFAAPAVRIGRVGDNAELRLIRDVAESRPNAIVTGPAALKLIGHPTLDVVEVVDLRYRNAVNASGRSKDSRLRFRGGKFSAEHIQEHDGIAHVHPIQALFDTYRHYGRLAALVPMESIRFNYQITEAELLTSAKLLPRSNGIKGFEELIRYSTNTSQSPLETLGRDAILQAEIPEIRTIEYQAEIRYTGYYGEFREAQVDVLINGWLVVEFDGRVKYSGKYGEPRDVTVAQLDRQNAVQALGYFFLRAGWGDVKSGKIVRDIERTLRTLPGKISA